MKHAASGTHFWSITHMGSRHWQRTGLSQVVAFFAWENGFVGMPWLSRVTKSAELPKRERVRIPSHPHQGHHSSASSSSASSSLPARLQAPGLQDSRPPGCNVLVGPRLLRHRMPRPATARPSPQAPGPVKSKKVNAENLMKINEDHWESMEMNENNRIT